MSMQKRIYCFLSVSVMLFTLWSHSTPCRAQGVSNDGKDFYLGYIAPSVNAVLRPEVLAYFGIYALVGSYEDTKVSVSYFDPQTGAESVPTEYSVAARQSIEILLDQIKMKIPGGANPLKQYRSCHITSKKPISVHWMSLGVSGTGSYCALPTSGLGKKYVIESWYDNPDGDGNYMSPVPEKACGVSLLIGAFEGTSVTITPASSQSSQPVTISLNRGECYLLRSQCTSSETDISGTTIVSDKPIAVISGHENAMLGGVNGYRVEGRDYMVEQALPVEQWDTKGYITCPLVDPAGLDANAEGIGETYRMYTDDTNGTNVSVKIAGFSGTRDYTLAKNSTPPTMFEIASPMHFYSTDGHPFSVMCYDERSASQSGPYPAPSMMTIVPISKWKKSYLWKVPAKNNPQYLSHTSYINIIGNLKGIAIFKNGVAVSINQAFTKVKEYYSTIPDYPGLQCAVYKIYEGSYFATSNYPFIVYHYSSRAIFAYGDNDLDGDEYYSEYAHPAGMSTQTGLSGTIAIKVDTGCAKLHFCIKDTRDSGGIRTISLIDDVNQYLVQNDFNIKGYRYVNCLIDPVLDPKGMQEIDYTGNDAEVCFDVLLDDISASGYVPLLIVDNSGKTRIIEATIPKPSFSFSVQDLSFGTLPYGTKKDTTISFTNPAASSSSYLISNVFLSHNDKSFQIVSTNPVLPALIAPGKTLTMSLRFSASDTSSHSDTLVVISDCLTKKIPMNAAIIYPQIFATDVDFGSVFIGKKSCKPILITNTGSDSFLLQKNFILADTINYSIDPASLSMLPLVLQPKQTITLSVCFSPTKVGEDASQIAWKSDINQKIESYGKPLSALHGKGMQQSSVKMDDVDFDLTLTPNPVDKGLLKVTLGTEHHGKIRIEIYDVLGRKWREDEFVNQNEFTVNVRDLAAGVYFLHFFTGDRRISRQFEVVK